MDKQLFQGRKVVIATMHQKERVIASVLESALGLRAQLCESLNTDLFGTFCGQFKRIESPVDTARAKCMRALALSGLDLAIASEGSFGPPPSIFFVPADIETLVLVDQKHDFEFVVNEISLSTNFNARVISNVDELMEFAHLSGFPDHGLILRKSADSYDEQIKGIKDEKTLKQHFLHLLHLFGEAYVETDMRAMFNPTRMNVIAQAMDKLIALIKNECPSCSAPGFALIEAIPGLPCNLCGLPTRSTLSHRYHCKKCDFNEEIKYPNQKEVEDAMYCDFCNP